MTKYPVMIRQGLRKGIFAAKVPHGWDMWIVWLNRECESGETFELKDIDGIDAQLHFGDKESVQRVINVLEWMINEDGQNAKRLDG